MTTLLTYGRRATLLEAADDTQTLALHRAVVAAAPPGLVEAVPAARTVLVTFVDEASRAAAQERLRTLVPVDGDEVAGRLVEVPTRYDGPDLDDVARLTGLSREEVVAAHTGVECTVGFVGFAPGFAYLRGVDERLHVPRRDEARTAVPPGAVALAGGLTAVPCRSPRPASRSSSSPTTPRPGATRCAPWSSRPRCRCSRSSCPARACVCGPPAADRSTPAAPELAIGWVPRDDAKGEP